MELRTGPSYNKCITNLREPTWTFGRKCVENAVIKRRRRFGHGELSINMACACTWECREALLCRIAEKTQKVARSLQLVRDMRCRSAGCTLTRSAGVRKVHSEGWLSAVDGMSLRYEFVYETLWRYALIYRVGRLFQLEQAWSSSTARATLLWRRQVRQSVQ